MKTLKFKHGSLEFESSVLHGEAGTGDYSVHVRAKDKPVWNGGFTLPSSPSVDAWKKHCVYEYEQAMAAKGRQVEK